MKQIIRKRYGTSSAITICTVDSNPDKNTFEIEIFNGMKITYNSTGLYLVTPIATDKIGEPEFITEFLANTGMSQELNMIITKELSICLRQMKNHTPSRFDFGL